jgi:ERCC4-type nuclease
MSLIIDYRETELIECLQRRGVPHRVEPLPVGDIWIGVPEQKEQKEQKDQEQEQQEQQEQEEQQEQKGTGGLVIERKRITDFEASFLDGRYREQRGRILSFCQPLGAQPVYLLEGAWTTLTGRITKKAMIKLLNRLTLRYQLPLLHTHSVEETAEWVECLLEQWLEDPTALKRTQELVKVSDGLHVQKKQNAADPKAFLMACLAQCSGVSVRAAESLVGAYATLTQIMALTAKQLEDHRVAGGNRRLGPAVAKRLWGLLHASE